MKKLFILLLCIGAVVPVTAQSEEDNKAQQLAEATDFSVPSSPAFVLLDATTAKVNKPAFTKDFKFDWVFKDNRLAPNIALEVQPIWMLFYKNINLVQYQKQEWFSRQLSTLSFSLGTVKKDTIQSLAWAIKLNLFREKKADPMMNENYIGELKKIIAFSPDEKRIALQLEGLKDAFEEETDAAKKTELLKKMEDLKVLLEKEDERKKKDYARIKKEFMEKTWNANMVDIGFGKAYNYFGEELEDLKFQSRGSGIWVNGSYNFNTSNFVVSALYKFLGGDSSTHFIGGNLRYGGSKINFFAEYIFEKAGSGKANTIAYGGDFRLNDILMIQFGLRTEYNKSFTLKSLKPLVNFNWLLKKN